MSDTMHVWEIEGADEYAIATDWHDAVEVFAAHYGETPDDFLRECSGDVIMLDDESMLTCAFPLDHPLPTCGKPVHCRNNHRWIEASAREWADNECRGYLFGERW